MIYNNANSIILDYIMTRKCYDKKLLQEICDRDKCSIDFDKIGKCNRDTRIDFVCNCGIEYCRTIRFLCNGVGGFCEKCTKNIKDNKRKQTCIERHGEKYTKFTKQGLIDACNRDKCKIDFDNIKTYNSQNDIDFLCNCGLNHKKKFKNIVIFGGFCEKCMKEKAKERIKQTCQDTWGVDHFTQLPEVKNKAKQTCFERYGVEHALQSQEVKNKAKQTCFERYGVEHALQSQTVKEKSKETCIKKFGCEYASQSEEFKERVKKTCNTKFGVDYLMQSKEMKDKAKQSSLLNNGTEYPMQSQTVKEKSKQTRLDKYGVEHALQSQEFKDKFKQTSLLNNGTEYPMQSQKIKDKAKQKNLLNYGAEHPMQNADFAEKASKNAYNPKEFNFPCGNSIQVQGYEPFLLKRLVEEGYTYEDIVVKRTEVPKIWYEKDNKQHRYYCDVYISKINTIYEVKSTWTYKKDIEDIPFKKQGCIDAGYLFELYVYDSKGVKQDL